jgi:outer membrane protein assembly factor BamB
MEQHVTWSVPLEGWGNATPVRFGGAVCVMIEPTTVSCHDPATGVQRWHATNDVLDTKTGKERDTLVVALAQAEADEAELQEVRKTYSQTQREARRGVPEAAQKLAQLTQRMGELRARLAEVASARTPPDKDIIGYGTATPVVRGDAMWVLTGHGVVSRFAPSGERVWSRYLGPPVEPMRGYDDGHASSPWWVDGVLIVPYGKLRGLDPDTGDVRWEHPDPWNHYGTPATGEVGGVGVVVTPAGDAVRARDGAVLARGLGELYYLGPDLLDGVLYFFGNSGNAERGDKRVVTRASRLSLDGDTLTASVLWDETRAADQRFYTQPLHHDGLIYAVSADAMLWIVDEATGERVFTRDFRPELPLGNVYPSPVIADGRLFITTYTGDTVMLSLADPRSPTVLGVNHLEETRASWLLEGGHMFMRSTGKLWRIGD